MNAQHLHAGQLLRVFRSMIERGDPPVHGYDEAAALIGLDPAVYPRHMGQVTSRIDAASFIAGWPMLALHMVRKPNGEMNPDSFSGGWLAWGEVVRVTAAAHIWTVEQVDEVIQALDGLPDVAASTIWAGYIRRNDQQPGFIDFNLHRKMRGKS